MKGFWLKTAQGLTPHDDAARESLHGIAMHTVVQVEVTRPRNIKFHRLYWALCSAIAGSCGDDRAEAVMRSA